MVFTEFRFLGFFLLAFVVHWALQSNKWRKVWLLLCSYVFYAAWDWRFCSLILFSTVVDYVCGLMLSRERPPGGRRTWLGTSLFCNFGLLGFFKYYNFFVDSAHSILGWLGLGFPLSTLHVILPVGISFYTFQSLSYTIDVYRGNLKAVRSPLDFTLFVSFFPQLVAGPIVRAVDFLPQLDIRRKLSHVDFRACLTLFLIGFVKKACISDNIAPLVDRYFGSPQLYSSGASWTASFYYAVQVYCDFSAYSDMAIASAGMLGYDLCLNFWFPLFATNIGDFWRRWHMSLSSWLRDYLYIPLGGNRGSRLFTYRNLMVTLVLCGLWHGAAWNYVLFGAVHGVAVISRVEWRARFHENSLPRRAMHWLGQPITFVFFCCSLIIFRPEGIVHSMTAMKAFLMIDSPGKADFGTSILWIYPVLIAAHWIAYRGWFSEPWKRLPGWLVYLLLGGGYSIALMFAAKGYQPFIYFQF